MVVKSRKLSVISCSNNPDMDYYFQLKKQAVVEAMYLGPSSCVMDSVLSIACFSNKNGPSVRLVLDILWALMQSIRLKFCGVTHVVFDNVHIANVMYGACFKILRIRQIHTIHDQVIHPGNNSRVTQLYYQYFCRYFADEYIFFSDNVFAFDSNKKGHKLKLCGFQKHAPEDVSGKDVLFFGRIQPYKGLEYLLGIAGFLENQYPQSRLIVMGSGESPYLQQLSNRANVQVCNRFFSKEELIEAARNSAVTVLPYTSATQSGVMIESYSLGLPVVSFDVGCLAEYCPNDDYGYTVPLSDTNAFNQKVGMFIDNVELCKNKLLNNFDQEFGVIAFNQQFKDFVFRLLHQ